MKNGVLKLETEDLIFAAQEQAIKVKIANSQCHPNVDCVGKCQKQRSI